MLVGVTMTRPQEIDWLYHGLRLLLPVEWKRFRAEVPASDRDGNLVEAYRQVTERPDTAVREKAARDGASGRTRRTHTKPSATPASTAPNPIRRSSRSCGYAPTTSPVLSGSMTVSYCEMRTASRASPEC